MGGILNVMKTRKNQKNSLPQQRLQANNEASWLEHFHFLLACWKQHLFCKLATGPQLDSLETLIRGETTKLKDGVLFIPFRDQKRSIGNS